MWSVSQKSGERSALLCATLPYWAHHPSSADVGSSCPSCAIVLIPSISHLWIPLIHKIWIFISLRTQIPCAGLHAAYAWSSATHTPCAGSHMLVQLNTLLAYMLPTPGQEQLKAPPFFSVVASQVAVTLTLFCCDFASQVANAVWSWAKLGHTPAAATKSAVLRFVTADNGALLLGKGLATVSVNFNYTLI